MTRWLSVAVAASFLPGAALPASAERLRVRIGAESPYSECYCRAKGQRFPVGEAVCLTGVDGPRMATCGMDQNVTTWRFGETACPDS